MRLIPHAGHRRPPGPAAIAGIATAALTLVVALLVTVGLTPHGATEAVAQTSCPTAATADISADCYNSSEGTITVTTATGDTSPSGVDGNQVSQLVNGDYLEYNGIDFGTGETQFDARVASGAGTGISGLVEVVLDSPSNTPVGSFSVASTGGWSTWETIPANITEVTGTHNVYLEFVSGAGGDPAFVSLHYFTFPGTGISPTPSPTPSVTPTPSPTPSSTATPVPGSGEPPASFWGDTSAIPAASGDGVLEVEILNQTNGEYPNSEVYWSFDGQTESIAEQPYIDLPVTTAGRMYFYLGSPDSQYSDFIEFNVGTSSINVDTTRVDGFGLKLAVLLQGEDGTDQEIGEDYATFEESRAATFARFEASVPTQFQGLATIDAPYSIPAPDNDPAFQPGGEYADYFNSALTAAGDTTDDTQDVFGCSGTLASNATLCAALNRGVAQLPASEQSDTSLFYQTPPANYYSQFWHENDINGLAYGFPYDDVDGQSTDISQTDPQYMVVAVGW
jgi:Carbohydrate binding module (family 6)/Beta-1,3-glucanase